MIFTDEDVTEITKEVTVQRMLKRKDDATDANDYNDYKEKSYCLQVKMKIVNMTNLLSGLDAFSYMLVTESISLSKKRHFCLNTLLMTFSQSLHLPVPSCSA